MLTSLFLLSIAHSLCSAVVTFPLDFLKSILLRYVDDERLWVDVTFWVGAKWVDKGDNY